MTDTPEAEVARDLARHPELRQRDGDQPLPIRNDGPDVLAALRDEIEARRVLGLARYGAPLQPHNGRDALKDLRDELLDGAAYATQLMLERAAAAAGAGQRDDLAVRLWAAARRHGIALTTAVVLELADAAAADLTDAGEVETGAALERVRGLLEVKRTAGAQQVDVAELEHALGAMPCHRARWQAWRDQQPAATFDDRAVS